MKNSSLQMLLRRLAAFLYDCMLLLAVFFVITAVAIPVNSGDAIESPIYKIALIPVAAFFYSWFWKRGGQTLGMRAWRIKVVNTDASVLSWKVCLLRFVLGVALFGITYLTMFFNKSSDALHDRLSKTRVILLKKANKQ